MAVIYKLIKRLNIMAVIQNNSQSDEHLVLHETPSFEGGAGRFVEYVIPHKRMNPDDATKVLDYGRREIPDEFIERVKKIKSVKAKFDDGSLVIVSGESAPSAEYRTSQFDDDAKHGIQSIEDQASATLVIPSKAGKTGK